MQLIAYLNKEALNKILKIAFTLEKEYPFILNPDYHRIVLVTHLNELTNRHLLHYYQTSYPIELEEIFSREEEILIRIDSPSLLEFAQEMAKRLPGSQAVSELVIHLGYLSEPIEFEIKGDFTIDFFDFEEN